MNENNISIIIPAAGVGRRMKSYGPKPLIKVGNSTIIKNQIYEHILITLTLF